MTFSVEKLEQLAQIAEALNRETDNLKDTVSELEKRLGKMNIGATVWLERLLEWSDEGNDTAYELGYTKIKDKWRIAVRVKGEEGSELPLSKAPRLVRAIALRHLDELLDLLTERATKFLETLKKLKAESEPAEAVAEEDLSVDDDADE
jgi:predicted  nucleic acid-binding Zn-ribbon protein